MSLGNTTENDLLGLAINAVALSGSWTTGAGSLRLHLHTADPGEAGTGSTSEATYTGYAAIQLTRGTTDFGAASGGVCTNANQLQFGNCTAGGPQTITHMSATLAGGQIILSGPVTPNIIVNTGVNPTFPAASISLSLD